MAEARFEPRPAGFMEHVLKRSSGLSVISVFPNLLIRLHTEDDCQHSMEEQAKVWGLKPQGHWPARCRAAICPGLSDFKTCL